MSLVRLVVKAISATMNLGKVVQGPAVVLRTAHYLVRFQYAYAYSFVFRHALAFLNSLFYVYSSKTQVSAKPKGDV